MPSAEKGKVSSADSTMYIFGNMQCLICPGHLTLVERLRARRLNISDDIIFPNGGRKGFAHLAKALSVDPNLCTGPKAGVHS